MSTTRAIARSGWPWSLLPCAAIACAGQQVQQTGDAGAGTPSGSSSGGSSSGSSSGASIFDSGDSGPVVLASGQTAVRLAVNATDLYWTNEGKTETAPDGGVTYLGGQVMRLPLAGGSPVTLITNQDHPLGIALDGINVYWTNSGIGTVMDIPLAGGTPTLLASGQNAPGSIADDDANLYWLNAGGAQVVSFPKHGGTPNVLAQGTAGGQGNIAVSPTNIYWTDTNAGAVRSFPIAVVPGPGTLIASGLIAPDGLALDATSVFWILETSGGAVERAPLGGGPATTLATGQSGSFGLAVDDTNVYWTNFVKDGSVMSVPKSGGSPTVLASGQIEPDGIVVDASHHVFWTTADGNVMGLALQ